MLDKQYIKGLQTQDRKIIRAIYENFAEPISKYVLKNGGTMDDAKDVFQDAILVLIEKAQSPDFELKSMFYTYFFSVNRFIWINKSKIKSRTAVTIPEDNTLIDESSIEQHLLDVELQNVYEENLAKLGIVCRKVLELFFQKKSMTEIAAILDLKNEHAARTKKYRCAEELKKLIRADVRYHELKK